MIITNSKEMGLILNKRVRAVEKKVPETNQTETQDYIVKTVVFI